MVDHTDLSGTHHHHHGHNTDGMVVGITSIVGPATTAATIIASALATASASGLAIIVTLLKISAWVMIETLIALVIVTLITIILIFALVWVLILLTSATEILTPEEMTYILTSVGSTSSRLTSVILVMVIIVSILIIVLILLCLCWQIFQFLLRLFASSSTSRLGLLRMGPFERLGDI